MASKHNNPTGDGRGIQLDPDTVLWGYRHGVFPMGDERSDQILWFSPDPRAVIDLDDFHVPRTLRQIIRQGKFQITLNRCFDRVIQSCADRQPTWITPAIVEAYSDLHRRQLAHSVEAWCDGELAGGLYGVTLGAAFFGESMFHKVTDASKIALVALVRQLQHRQFTLLDIQYITRHLARFGAYTIPRSEYLKRLEQALATEPVFAPEGQSHIDLLA